MGEREGRREGGKVGGREGGREGRWEGGREGDKLYMLRFFFFWHCIKYNVITSVCVCARAYVRLLMLN